MENDKIQGICCTVCDCHYHTKDDCCTAKKIVVKGDCAKTSCETECETFKPCC